MVTEGRSTSARVRSPGRRERRRNETLEKLLLAAMELFGTKGFANTTVEEITEAADVGKGTFFNYFPSKQHVLSYFMGRQLGRVEHHLELLKRDGEQSVEPILRSLARDLAKLPSRSPEMARTVVAAFLGDAEVRDFVTTHMERGREMVAEMMRHAQARNEFRGDIEPGEMARIFQQAIFGTILMWSLHPRLAVPRMLDSTLEVLMHGLRSPRRTRVTRKEVGR